MATTAGTNNFYALESEWRAQLSQWATSGRLEAAALEAIHLSSRPSALQELIAQWAKGDFSGLPPIELLSASAIPGAAGAYAASTGTIYLNQEWLAGASNTEAIAVLTEELGHHLDVLLNAADTPGDEGELFARLLAGEVPTAELLVAIRADQDQGPLTDAGQVLAVEQAELPQISVTATANGNEADGTPAVFTFSRTGDTAAPLSVGYRLFGTAKAGRDYSGSSGIVSHQL